MIIEGDCVEAMRAMPEASVDAIVTDPPYSLGFMSKPWDMNVQHERWSREALRILKPGGHLLAFGGTRTYHRLASAVEDAGFEIRDCLAWMFGSGFPKSLDVSKAIDKAAGAERDVVGRNPNHREPDTDHHARWNDAVISPNLTAPATPDAERWQGWGTALKPAHEPIVVARKPLIGTVAANVLEHGTGALNVDGCRIGDELITAHGGGVNGEGRTYGMGAGIPALEPGANPHHGRWPANVLLDQEAAAILDEQTGERRSAGEYVKGARTQGPKNGAASIPIDGLTSATYADRGGASRFFYCAKASSRERNAGLDGFEERAIEIMDDRPSGDSDQRRGRRAGQPRVMRNVHPTVKPIELMRWLCRLVTPPGGTVLDPFTGSGTTGCAAELEGFEFVGIERDPEYAAIARARIAHWQAEAEELAA